MQNFPSQNVVGRCDGIGDTNTICSGGLRSHCVTFPANAANVAQYKDRTVAYMIYYLNYY